MLLSEHFPKDLLEFGAYKKIICVSGFSLNCALNSGDVVSIL